MEHLLHHLCHLIVYLPWFIAGYYEWVKDYGKRPPRTLTATLSVWAWGLATWISASASLRNQTVVYDGHMGPFDPTRNTQPCIPGTEWRALIVSPAAGNLCGCPEYEFVNNCWRSDGVPAVDTGNIHTEYINILIKSNQETDKQIETLHWAYEDYFFFDNE